MAAAEAIISKINILSFSQRDLKAAQCIRSVIKAMDEIKTPMMSNASKFTG